MFSTALCMSWIPGSAILCHHDTNKADEEASLNSAQKSSQINLIFNQFHLLFK